MNLVRAPAWAAAANAFAQKRISVVADDSTDSALPPDTTPPEGDGAVVFSVMPRKHFVTNAKVTNYATVVFDSNAPIKTPTWINHVAGNVPQLLSVTPPSLVFHHVPIFGTADGTSSPQAVTLTNPGPNSMVVANVTASADFLVGANACRMVLLAGQSCIFGVRFRPAELGTTLGQLTINDNATKAPQIVALKGIGVAGSLTFKPTALAFGKVALGATSPPQKLKVTNATNAQATIASVAASAEFVTSNDTCTGATLSAAQSCTVGVAFSPTGTAGPVTGSLTVTTDAQTQQVMLSGTGAP